MLTIHEKIILIKQVDCHAFSYMRVKALTELKTQFRVEDVKEISDLLYLRDETVLQCLS